MKRFAMASVAVFAVLSLTACGNAEKEKAMQTQIDSCTKDKAGADAKVTELQAKVDQMTKDMEAAKAAATPAATPEVKGGKPGAKATPAAKATPTAKAAMTPAATPAPRPVIMDPGMKGPGAKTPK